MVYIYTSIYHNNQPFMQSNVGNIYTIPMDCMGNTAVLFIRGDYISSGPCLQYGRGMTHISTNMHI